MSKSSEMLSFIVDYEYIRWRYTNLGIVGRGKDPILDICSTINLVQEMVASKILIK